MQIEVNYACDVAGIMRFPGQSFELSEAELSSPAVIFELGCRVGSGGVSVKGQVPKAVDAVAAKYALWREGKGERPTVKDLEGKAAKAAPPEPKN